jgi:HSP20 family molecular chaperone IbpA
MDSPEAGTMEPAQPNDETASDSSIDQIPDASLEDIFMPRQLGNPFALPFRVPAPQMFGNPFASQLAGLPFGIQVQVEGPESEPEQLPENPLADLLHSFHPIHLNQFPQLQMAHNPILLPHLQPMHFMGLPFMRPHHQHMFPFQGMSRSGAIPAALSHMLEEIPAALENFVQKAHEVTPGKQPMILKLDEHDDFFVVSGFFPGVNKTELKLKLNGNRLIVKGNVTEKTEQTKLDLGEFADVDEVDEVMELPYAPDARLCKARFDATKYTLTVVFPKPKTTDIELL